MDNKHSIHMTIDEFKNNGYKVIDWLADYYKNVDSFPVLSQVDPGYIRGQLPDQPPEDGETFEAMLADMNEKILPGITHWQSPNFFAFFLAIRQAQLFLVICSQLDLVCKGCCGPLARPVQNWKHTSWIGWWIC